MSTIFNKHLESNNLRYLSGIMDKGGSIPPMPLCAKLLSTLKDEQSHLIGEMEYLMGYGRFIEIGVERQNESITVDEATRNYARSCECCMNKGLNFDCDCDYCPITVAHRDKLDTILTLRQLEHERRVQNDELKKKLDEITSMIGEVYEMISCPNELDKHNESLDALVEKWIRLKGGDKYVKAVQ